MDELRTFIKGIADKLEHDMDSLDTVAKMDELVRDAVYEINYFLKNRLPVGFDVWVLEAGSADWKLDATFTERKGYHLYINAAYDELRILNSTFRVSMTAYDNVWTIHYRADHRRTYRILPAGSPPPRQPETVSEDAS